MDKNITYEIVEHISTLSTSNSGWTKELNLVSWNGRTPVYDIREWSPDKTKLGKGCTFNAKEICILVDALANVGTAKEDEDDNNN